ncbi:MAG TPA: J domain-containing protein [Bryobacteraceae bacterium]|nr:J domain-containing protein [Bryobacteraceae bacterium]
MSSASYDTFSKHGRYAGDRRPFAAHFQALGVSPDATWEQVRQAYKDLVRVWHPDRFQNDPQLRERAQQQLRKVNDAYLALKNSHVFGEPEEPAPAPPRSTTVNERPPSPPRPRRRQWRFSAWVWELPLQRSIMVVAVCLMPLLFAGLLLNALRVPALDSILDPGSLPRPAILMPARFIDPLDSRADSAAMLAGWARGEVVDLWRSLPKIGEGSSGPASATPAVVVPNAAPSPPDVPRRAESGPAAPVMPVNGTEMLWTRRSGASELWITNETDKDALATLVTAHTTEPLRAIYIQAKNKVCVKDIAVGVDELVAEVGDDWDPRKLRFRSGRQSLGRSGPFNFYELASAEGSSGRKYEVVLKMR